MNLKKMLQYRVESHCEDFVKHYNKGHKYFYERPYIEGLINVNLKLLGIQYNAVEYLNDKYNLELNNIQKDRDDWFKSKDIITGSIE